MSSIKIGCSAGTSIRHNTHIIMASFLLSALLAYAHYQYGFKFALLFVAINLLGLLIHLASKIECTFDAELNALFLEKSIFAWRMASEKTMPVSDFSYVYVKEGRYGYELTLFSTIRDELVLFSVELENAESEAQRVAGILNITNKGVLMSKGFSQ
ncbi:hypothetical protein HQN60_08340 [Deefgea piscis]|uniref:Uncharacterized protein n=1 Tax=Deefgea piscis TaxID=2739061 RepID=A0A6M8SRH5_9NEIS|nr:hypothetical protein [Deefgea piscis]QKJ66708.1 hypothetical protein HQN60_08340 [Deefgea piscis]